MRVGQIFLAFCLLGLVTSVTASEPASNNIIRLAATTSIDNSGLLPYLLPKFTDKYPYRIELKIVGSGKALRLGRTGAVDMVWVHSPPAEKKFVDEEYGIHRHTVMRNDFVIAGPVADPGKIAATAHAYQALQHIAQQGLTFVSRADDSGTNKKELVLWKKAGIDPYGKGWYLEAGSGMAATLELAQQQNAYLLIDRATFLVRKNDKLKILLEDPINLSNPYSVIAVNPDKHQTVNRNGVDELINWLASAEGQKAIGDYQFNGVQLYTPVNATTKNH